MPDLEALIADLTRNEKLGQSEMATRLWAVDPVLEALGWRLRDPGEVEPEYSVRGGSVDYCLKGNRAQLVLIEAKRAGTDLTGHQEQLLRYAFDEGTPLATLTDGLVWWLYLTRATGNWEQRRFFSLDFRQQETARAAADLRRFLGRDAVVGGDALEAAQREFDSQERDRLVRAALSRVWRRLITQPTDTYGETLHDLLAEAVENEAGHRPDHETVHQFLRGTLRQEPVSAAPSFTALGPSAPRTQPGRGSRDASTPQRLQQEPRRRRGPPRRITGFHLNGTHYNVSTWIDLLLRVCDLTTEEAGERFAELVAPLGGRSAYFNHSSENLRAPRALKNGLFVETNLNSRQCERLARDVLSAVRGPRGADSFTIELAG